MKFRIRNGCGWEQYGYVNDNKEYCSVLWTHRELKSGERWTILFEHHMNNCPTSGEFGSIDIRTGAVLDRGFYANGKRDLQAQTIGEYYYDNSGQPVHEFHLPSGEIAPVSAYIQDLNNITEEEVFNMTLAFGDNFWSGNHHVSV